ncbi:MAG: site-2 protease family protein [Candidatus Pacebacteria bacterium]|nr:site-2 protease family protein [Candidatus Paceibacterota bacterium]MBP9700954.1 site-2 protease family protein [Candidatus Paceibacterota bacterium]
MQGPISIFYFLILMISIIVHEVAHGLMAEREGDPTARMLGRITLNPLKHIDWLGSVILPLVLILSNAGFVVGWAKPVPYNPDNLKHGNKSVAKVSIAGIVVNLGIAVVFGLLIRVSILTGLISTAFIDIASIIVLVNIVLALFNAIPLAPLDGFRFLSAVLPARFQPTMRLIEQYSLPLLLIFIVFGWKVVAPFAFTLFTLITGINI